MLGFQSFLEERAETLDTIPDDHLVIVASLVQESDKSATELAKLVRATVLPEGHQALGKVTEDGQPLDVLPVAVIQNAIQAIAERVNYGLDGENLAPALQLWRWEVQNLDLLPKENLDKLMARREERVAAKQEALALFEALPEEQKGALREGKKLTKPKDEPQQAPEVKEVPMTPGQKEKLERVKLRETKKAERQAERQAKEAEKQAERQAKEAEKQAERQAKEAEKQAERQAKEAEKQAKEAERQAKENKVEKGKQAQVRLFNSFFQQASPRSPSVRKDDVEEKNDFQRTFLPCEYKNMAEINRFYRPATDALLQEMDARSQSQGALLTELTHLGKTRAPRTTPRARGIHPPVSVRHIMKTVQESDVLGGNAEEHAKRELEKLNNRRLVPIKLLQFQSDRRPGWVGTWTRSSTFITPRKPFGQDPVSLDYSYDSDAEWEEVEEGENVDAMDDREEEESMGGSDNEDSEMDDWLEDDLEEDDEAPPPEEVEPPSSPLAHSSKDPTPKGVNLLQPKKKVKLLGRRFDSKLVPYYTGPHWENTLGEPGHESFAPYRIQFFNGMSCYANLDAHVGLDPFTFTSTTVSFAPAVDEAAGQAGTNESASAAPATTASRSTKFSFPDTHLPELLKLIQGSTRSKPALLEDLREHFGPIVKGVSKTAIEARLQECAAKESKKPGAKWIIKPEWQSQLHSA